MENLYFSHVEYVPISLDADLKDDKKTGKYTELCVSAEKFNACSHEKPRSFSDLESPMMFSKC